MSRRRNQHIIQSIHNGNEEILFYLSRLYFQSARRLLRRKGISDSSTPRVFATILTNVYREIKQKKLSAQVDFESYLFNSIRDFSEASLHPDQDVEIVSACFGILDESSRKILSSRYADRISFEEIATRCGFSNAVIAEHEVNKAMSQFEKIAAARLNMPSRS